MVTQVHAAHILVRDQKKANEIKEELNKGANFADLAKKFSTCPSKKKGGDLGWFKKGDMVQEFETAAFSAQKGSIVGPVKTEFGYHIIKVLETK